MNRATLERFGVELTDSQKLIPVSPGSFATTKIDTAGTPLSKSPLEPKKTIFRATPDQIKAAQRLLKSLSEYTGDETGKLDEPTRGALRRFQDATGLKITGTLNPATLRKMDIELTVKQKVGLSVATPAN